MEEEIKKTIEETPVTPSGEVAERSTVKNQSSTTPRNKSRITEIAFNVTGIICLIFAVKWYGLDLDTYTDNPFSFTERTYVGADA